jgi:hypothetical protein
MRQIFRDNGLSITLFLLFAFSLFGQSWAGYRQHNQVLREHHAPSEGYWEYVRSAAFVESVFENWESEFLQMALYVWLTSFLYQRGSAESKDPDKKEEGVDEDPCLHRDDPDAPIAVRAGGLRLRLYEQSLFITLLLLFVVSFILHLVGSVREACNDNMMHGQPCSSTLTHLLSAQFWFESMQNWQSEFLSVGAVIVLSIFLRQRGSPESKPVHSPHRETGR